MDGKFVSIYTFVHDGQKITAMIHSGDIERSMVIGGRTYSYNGRVVQNSDTAGRYPLIGQGVFISCIPGAPNKNDPKKEFQDIDKPPRAPETAVYDHYTFGDVEGSTSFLDGCLNLRDELKKMNYLSRDANYVSIGDTIGQANIFSQPTGPINNATTIAFANKAIIKIIGNRDLNKVRVPAEFLHQQALGAWYTTKEEFINTTYPFKLPFDDVSDKRLDGLWLHNPPNLTASPPNPGTPWPGKGKTIIDTYKGQYEKESQTSGEGE
jgi:hypothetical protein